MCHANKTKCAISISLHRDCSGPSHGILSHDEIGMIGRTNAACARRSRKSERGIPDAAKVQYAMGKIQRLKTIANFASKKIHNWFNYIFNEV